MMQRYLYRLILCATITQCTLCLGFAKMTTTVGSLRTPLRTNQFSLNQLSNPLMRTAVGSRRVIGSGEKCCPLSIPSQLSHARALLTSVCPPIATTSVLLLLFPLGRTACDHSGGKPSHLRIRCA